jgi:hypothetical protein
MLKYRIVNYIALKRYFTGQEVKITWNHSMRQACVLALMPFIAAQARLVVHIQEINHFPSYGQRNVASHIAATYCPVISFTTTVPN